MHRVLSSFAILGIVTFAVPAARAQEAPRRKVVAGEKYQASGLHRALFGADYRDLWATPIEVPVLDLQRYGTKATFFEPHQYAEGVDHVIANGQFLVDSGKLTWKLPGRILMTGPARP